MRVLIYPHDLGMGGSQINAIDLAARVRDHGVETMVFGRPGVLVDRIHELGLEFIESPDPGRRPSISIARHLRQLAHERRIDVLHGYEWPPSLECSAAAGWSKRTIAMSTVMSMAVPPFIPKTTPLIVGTEQIAEVERSSGRRLVQVIEPPVDLQLNVAPAVEELDAFRRNWGISPDRMLLVCVTRLADELKSEGLLSAIEAVSGPLLEDLSIQLLIVGDGPARDTIQAAAARANERRAGSVIMTGQLADPRSAYAIADVVLGMGGSALRALAFSKPLIVQGERGYFRLLDEDSLPEFAWQGWYGVGSDADAGPEALARILRQLVTDPARCESLSAFGHQTLTSRFSLEAAASRQAEIYRRSARQTASQVREAASGAQSAGRFLGYYARRKTAKILGRSASDDFNAKPVAASGPRQPTNVNAAATRRQPIVYFAGVAWDGVAGTDVRLVTELGRRRPVVWVDPPTSILHLSFRQVRTPVSRVSEGVTRIRPLAPPGAGRPGVRSLSRWWSYALVRTYLLARRRRPAAVISSSPDPVLTQWRRADVRRVYFATDDFVAGADLMGMSRKYLGRSQQQNLDAAQIVLAVTEHLAERLSNGTRPRVFPNGCDPEQYADLDKVPPSTEIRLSGQMAGVIGQFNPRLDLDYLLAVADAGVSLLLVGPLVDRDADFVLRFSRLADHINVQWVGRRPAAELPQYFSALSVGLTPYADSDFNRSSCPLKTLEYVAAGLPVVSTALPAAKSLDPRFVAVASTREEFAAATLSALNGSDVRPVERREFAEQHSWRRRATELDALLG